MLASLVDLTAPGPARRPCHAPCAARLYQAGRAGPGRAEGDGSMGQGWGYGQAGPTWCGAGRWGPGPADGSVSRLGLPA